MIGRRKHLFYAVRQEKYTHLHTFATHTHTHTHTHKYGESPQLTSVGQDKVDTPESHPIDLALPTRPVPPPHRVGLCAYVLVVRPVDRRAQEQNNRVMNAGVGVEVTKMSIRTPNMPNVMNAYVDGSRPTPYTVRVAKNNGNDQMQTIMKTKQTILLSSSQTRERVLLEGLQTEWQPIWEDECGQSSQTRQRFESLSHSNPTNSETPRGVFFTRSARQTSLNKKRHGSKQKVQREVS